MEVTVEDGGETPSLPQNSSSEVPSGSIGDIQPRRAKDAHREQAELAPCRRARRRVREERRLFDVAPKHTAESTMCTDLLPVAASTAHVPEGAR